jgi:single-stranded-DNA-specific exonuclease
VTEGNAIKKKDIREMTQTKWMLHAKKADFNKIAENFGISPVTARIIRNRGIEDMESIRHYLHGSIEDLHDPRLLPDMEKAVGILRRKAAEGKTIRIVGDYDIDGVCSTYLLYRALKRIGARVDYEIPDRIKDGYGINEMIIEAAASDGIDTILTCDNGIAAVSQIARAKKLGMTVIVTDHHDILVEENEEDLPEGGREVLPPADAIVNPKLRGCAYPFTGICGGMVAFKLVQVLFEESGVLAQEWLDMLEIAAIATVGDVMKLQGENRIIVKEGLRCLGHTSNLGLKKLIEKNNLVPGSITAYHIGFVIGPCLNASGRLQTAKIALSLLLCEDEEEADRMAMELKELNDQRKDMTQAGIDQAAAMVEERYLDDKVLVVFLPDCHESLAGIVAGRLRERYNKPSFVLTRAEGCAKGSGRSIEAYHMFHALVEVKDLLLKFGGHPMAAGFSLEEKDVDEFRRRLNENARERLTEEDFIPRVWIDVAMPFEYITEPFVRELELLEPYGQGNEKPQFAQKSMVIRSAHVMGRNRNVVRLSLVNERGVSMDGVVFTDGDLFMEEKGNSRLMDVIYYPGINEYNGNRNLQIVVKDWKFH